MGLGEAALFVGAATLIADLSPPHRRAESASYFSVAVYGGIGLGPTIGEWVLGDGRYELTFLVAAGFSAAGRDHRARRAPPGRPVEHAGRRR